MAYFKFSIHFPAIVAAHYADNNLYLLATHLGFLNNGVIHLTGNDGLDLSLETGLAFMSVPWVRTVLGKHELHLLECLATRLWEEDGEPCCSGHA
jgi:hypothetical protein